MNIYLLFCLKLCRNSLFHCFQCLICLLSAISSILCLTAAVFTGYHGFRILSYSSCLPVPPSHCVCTFHSNDPLAQIFVYTIQSCDLIYSLVIFLLLAQCLLNLTGGIVSFAHIMLLWRSRYGNFYSGLKFYSYAADTPPHPWFDRSHPPYTTESAASLPRQPRVTVRQASHSMQVVRA